MNTADTLAYLDSLPLEQALLWYIENPLPKDVETAAFFRLRERMRSGWSLPHRKCGHSDCGQNFIDTGDVNCLHPDERTDYEKGPEYARVLRSVLSVIDAMQAPKELDEVVAAEEELIEDEVTINDQFWFGTFANWRQHETDSAGYDLRAVVEWPDLAWAKDQIVKVLGS